MKKYILSALLLLSVTQLFSQRNIVEEGPFKPFGGKKETKYSSSKQPLEIKEFDVDGNLRRHVLKKEDPRQRIIETTDEIYDFKGKIISGVQTLTTFKDDLDIIGKTNYKRYDLQKQSYEWTIIAAPQINNPNFKIKLDSFYTKFINANGIPIACSNKTPNTALLVAHDIINYMLTKRPDIRQELIKRGSRVSIMAESEMETDLPERSSWKKPLKSDGRLTPYELENYDKPGGIASLSDQEYWNQRARGMGGNIVSCAEENLLGYPATRYYGENILVHEFSHNMMDALRTVDPKFYADIQKAYNSAKSKGMYKNQYAINTVAEYWAEGSQWWFNSNFPFYEGSETRIKSAQDLKNYDPTLYNLFEKVYLSNHIPADIYYKFRM